MNKRTPGPWNLSLSGGHPELRADDDSTVAEVRTSCIGDLRLLAAAPDLLDALIRIVDDGSIGPFHMNLAIDAIAKAKGK